MGKSLKNAWFIYSPKKNEAAQQKSEEKPRFNTKRERTCRIDVFVADD